MAEVGFPLQSLIVFGISDTVHLLVCAPVVSILTALLILRCVYDYFNFLCYRTRGDVYLGLTDTKMLHIE